MSKLTTFICDQCQVISEMESKKGWLTMYASIDPDKVGKSSKQVVLHLCPKCAREAVFKLWDDPVETAAQNKKILAEKTKVDPLSDKDKS